MPSSAHDAKRSRLNRRIPFHLFSPPRQAGIRLGIVLQGAQILCSFFPSPAVGKEGPEQQVWSKESIKVQEAIESPRRLLHSTAPPHPIAGSASNLQFARRQTGGDTMRFGDLPAPQHNAIMHTWRHSWHNLHFPDRECKEKELRELQNVG